MHGRQGRASRAAWEWGVVIGAIVSPIILLAVTLLVPHD